MLLLRVVRKRSNPFVSMTAEKNISLHPISEVLCATYERLVSSGEVTFGLYEEQINKLDSIAKTVLATYFGVPRFPSRKQRAAAFFVLLIKDHPVIEGNKRLAVSFLQLYCDTFRMDLHLPVSISLDKLALAVEKVRFYDDLVDDIRSLLFHGSDSSSLDERTT